MSGDALNQLGKDDLIALVRHHMEFRKEFAGIPREELKQRLEEFCDTRTLHKRIAELKGQLAENKKLVDNEVERQLAEIERKSGYDRQRMAEKVAIIKRLRLRIAAVKELCDSPLPDAE